ncbi:hypothetical protein HOA59_00685 [archaeon]|jgi:signal peptidase I|nr:hypothetical protein [archaeon]MBT6823936.1 hypothetical protein [archaeon]MBT7107166.1 hypothetical protein [archaeon]MBT7297764.1 hypothetical protein [archaeon]
MKKTVILIGLIFMLGWLSNSAYSIDFEEPSSIFTTKDLISPQDWVNANQIFVYQDYIVIKVSGANLVSYADTNSMDPLLDSGANGLEIIPQSEEHLQIGDIITYEADWNSNLVVHRIIFIGEDDEGWYCITKGDNSRFTDPGKIRFDKIKYILIGVIY